MKTLALLSLILLCLSSFAKGGAELNFAPIVGLERVTKVSPVRRTKTRTIIGARASFGIPLLSLEGQLTRSEDTETQPEEDLTEDEESYAAMLGLRSSIRFGFLSWFLRAGGHARKSTYTRTVGDVTTTREPAIYISPYAGTGLGIRFMNNFWLNAGYTVIFTGRPRGSDTDTQATLSFGVRI